MLACRRFHRETHTCLQTTRNPEVAVGQNQSYHFGVCAPPILVYFSGDWDVHWGYGFLTHGQVSLSTHGRCYVEGRGRFEALCPKASQAIARRTVAEKLDRFFAEIKARRQRILSPMFRMLRLEHVFLHPSAQPNIWKASSELVHSVCFAIRRSSRNKSNFMLQAHSEG